MSAPHVITHSLDLETINVSSRNGLWSSLSQYLKSVSYDLKFDTVKARSSLLGKIRELRNNPRRANMIHSIVAIGAYTILELNQTDNGLSPFNIYDDFQNTSLSLDQVRKLYRQFAVDHGLTIASKVMDSIFCETSG
ncbi:hypothetical protein BGW38_001929, partial [Lunasporangiospora selenospora]